MMSVFFNLRPGDVLIAVDMTQELQSKSFWVIEEHLGKESQKNPGTVWSFAKPGGGGL